MFTRGSWRPAGLRRGTRRLQGWVQPWALGPVPSVLRRAQAVLSRKESGNDPSWACLPPHGTTRSPSLLGLHLPDLHRASLQLLASLDPTHRAYLLLATLHDQCPQVQVLWSCHPRGRVLSATITPSRCCSITGQNSCPQVGPVKTQWPWSPEGPAGAWAGTGQRACRGPRRCCPGMGSRLDASSAPDHGEGRRLLSVLGKATTVLHCLRRRVLDSVGTLT